MYLSGWPKIYSFYYIIIQEVQTWQTRKCPYCQLVFPTSLIKTHMKNYCLKRGQASSIEAESTDESSCDTSIMEERKVEQQVSTAKITESRPYSSPLTLQERL